MRTSPALSSALLLVAIGANDACAAETAAACEKASKLAHWEVAALDSEARHRIFLGMSESEFQRHAKRAAQSKEFNAQKDRTWTGPGDTLYIVDEFSQKQGRAVIQMLLFEKSELVFLSDQVSDDRGSSALTREDADSLLADYRGYMCWRFGAVAARSTMGPEARSGVLGPAQIYDQVSASDERYAMDAFITEDLSGSDGFMVMVVTRMASFGRK